MARTYVNKGVHTSPDKAGEQNLEGVKLPKGGGINAQIYPIHKKGMANIYKSQWTNEELLQSIQDFIFYCSDNDVKPTQPLLRMWLGVSRTQFYEWRTNVAKFGERTNIMAYALDYMESYLQANIDQYPTGSIFLLKSSFQHIETSKLDVTTNGSNITGQDEVQDLVKNLGLDKQE